MEAAEFEVKEDEAGLRLDLFLVGRLHGVSRSEVKRAIEGGFVSISASPCRQPARRVRAGERVGWAAPVRPLLTPHEIPIPIIHEDDEIVVVNKPAGMVVHPGAGTDGGTLVEGLIRSRTLPVDDDPARPGIVHRLDKETSGILVVAKTEQALSRLKAQFAAREVTKIYLGLVEGRIEEDEGLIDAPVGRDPARPRVMGVTPNGRPAQTAFNVLSRLSAATLLSLQPRTGRTHQLRVHLRYIGHPIVGDPLYGEGGEHMYLHAWRISFLHPKTGKRVRFEAMIPPWFPVYPYEEVPWPGEQAARR